MKIPAHHYNKTSQQSLPFCSAPLSSSLLSLHIHLFFLTSILLSFTLYFFLLFHLFSIFPPHLQLFYIPLLLLSSTSPHSCLFPLLYIFFFLSSPSPRPHFPLLFPPTLSRTCFQPSLDAAAPTIMPMAMCGILVRSACSTCTSLEDTRSRSGATPPASMATASRAAISSLEKVCLGSAASRFSSMLMLTSYEQRATSNEQRAERTRE